MKFEKGRGMERSGKSSQIWASKQADTKNLGYMDSWKMANWQGGVSEEVETRKNYRKGNARDNDRSQKQSQIRGTRASDGVERKRRPKDQKKATTQLPEACNISTITPKVTVDCKHVAREDGTMSPSQVSTASGVSSPLSSPHTTSPRLDALIALRTCMPNAAINLDKPSMSKQDLTAAALAAGNVPQLHTEIETLMKHNGGQDVETYKFQRGAAGEVGTVPGREPFSKRISLSDVLDRCSQESNQPAPAQMMSYSPMNMQAAHLGVNMPSLPDQPLQSQALPGGYQFNVSSHQTAPPPPYMPGHFLSQSALPPAPTHWPDLAPTGCAAYQTAQVDVGCGAWYPAGLEVPAAVEQPLFHMIHEWTAGATATEIEGILKAAQPYEYQD